MLQTYACTQYTQYTIQNESKHSEMGPVRQNPTTKDMKLSV